MSDTVGLFKYHVDQLSDHSIKNQSINYSKSIVLKKGINIDTLTLKIKKLEVSATLHTTHSYGFAGMFSSNALLEYADCIDVSVSSRVDSMFAYCYNLKTIGGINAPKSNNFSKLFYFCYNLNLRVV